MMPDFSLPNFSNLAALRSLDPDGQRGPIGTPDGGMLGGIPGGAPPAPIRFNPNPEPMPPPGLPQPMPGPMPFPVNGAPMAPWGGSPPMWGGGATLGGATPGGGQNFNPSSFANLAALNNIRRALGLMY